MVHRRRRKWRYRGHRTRWSRWWQAGLIELLGVCVAVWLLIDYPLRLPLLQIQRPSTARPAVVPAETRSLEPANVGSNHRTPPYRDNLRDRWRRWVAGQRDSD